MRWARSRQIKFPLRGGSLAGVGFGDEEGRRGQLAHYERFLFDRIGDDVMLVELIKP